MHTEQNHTNALLLVNIEVGLEESEELMYIFMSCDQNAKLNHNIKVGNKSFENTISSNIWSQLQD